MRKRALRWFGFGVPLGCLVAAALGAFKLSGGAISLYMLAQAASLGAPDAFSRCAAKQMSTKKVMGSLIVAVILALIAPAAMAIYRHCIGEITIPELLVYGAVALTTVVRCFEELFASQNDTTSATMTATLTAIGLGAAMVIISGDFSISKLGGGMMFFGSMAVVAVTSGSIAIAFSRHELPKPNFAILKEIPAAMGRLLLYPAMCAGLLWLDGWNENLLRGELCAALAGLLLLEVFRSTFRRRPEEAAGLKTGVALTMLIGTGALLGLGCWYWDVSFPMCQAIFLAAGAAVMLLYAPIDWETAVATLILMAGSVLIAVGITPEYCSFPHEIFIGPAAGLIACIAMARQWGQLFRQARANRIRKKAMKKSRI